MGAIRDMNNARGPCKPRLKFDGIMWVCRGWRGGASTVSRGFTPEEAYRVWAAWTW